MHAAHWNVIQSKLDAAVIFARPILLLSVVPVRSTNLLELLDFALIHFDADRHPHFLYGLFCPPQPGTVPTAVQFTSGIMAI